MRYILQEMNVSGFTHYEIIDTENKCEVVYISRDYATITRLLTKLNKPKNTKGSTTTKNIIKKIKKVLFILINLIMGFIFLFSICCIDSGINLYFYTLIISGLYLVIVAWVNGALVFD